MKIAILGSSGQLGFDLTTLLAHGPHTPLPFSGRAQLDICDAPAFAAMLDASRPDAVINTAAFHNVDLCEKETDAAYRTNVVAVREMAKACESRAITFMQIGTDYVTEGAPQNRPIPESAPVHPNSIYSLTRFGGDAMTLAHAPTHGYVVRSCGLFGVAGCKLKGGLNFVDTMINAAKAGKPLRVVDDQIVAPPPTDDLARQLLLILEKHPPTGLYHAVSHGQCSWFTFAKTALELSGIPHSITPVPSTTYAAPAKRPAYSVLDNAKLRALNLDIMRPWQESLERFVKTKYPKS
jgi:dTDP-4-dehydrorhamnose reductase